MTTALDTILFNLNTLETVVGTFSVYRATCQTATSGWAWFVATPEGEEIPYDSRATAIERRAIIAEAWRLELAAAQA